MLGGVGLEGTEEEGGRGEESSVARAHRPVRLLVISLVTMNIYKSSTGCFAGLHLNNHEYVSMYLHLMGCFSVFKEPGGEWEQGDRECSGVITP